MMTSATAVWQSTIIDGQKTDMPHRWNQIVSYIRGVERPFNSYNDLSDVLRAQRQVMCNKLLVFDHKEYPVYLLSPTCLT